MIKKFLRKKSLETGHFSTEKREDPLKVDTKQHAIFDK